MAALIGALRASLSADTANFEQGMRRAQRQADTTSSSIAKSFGKLKGDFFKGFVGGLTGALTFDALIRVGRAALDHAASLGELSQQLGVTTRDLQTFRYASGQVGVSQEQLETGLGKLTITLGKVAAGAKAPTEALQAIGISVAQLKGKDTGGALRIISDGLAKVQDRSQRAAVEVALFGKSGAALDNLLAGGSKSLNELASAAERLGIVLSDEQIAKADEAADKFAALQTVLSSRIAGIVADNAGAIMGLIGVLDALIRKIGDVIRGWNNLRAIAALGIATATGDQAGAARARGRARDENGFTLPGRSVTVDLAPARKIKQPAPSGGDIGRFLAGGGKPPKPPKDRSAEEAERKRLEALRDANQFDQEQRRAQQDILRAQQGLAAGYVERAAIAVQILDSDRAAYAAQLEYEVATKDKTRAQASSLMALYDQRDALERQAILQDKEEQRQREFNAFEAQGFDIQRGILDQQAQLATTAAERRRIELAIVELAYREQRERLERITQESKDWAEIEQARRDLMALPQQQALAQQNAVASTRGPMEQWQADAMNTTDAMEQLKVQGIEGAVDALVALRGGFGDMRETAIAAIQDIIAALMRMMIMKAIAGAIGGGGGPDVGALNSAGASMSGFTANTAGIIPSLAFAGGGGFNILGRGGVDRNIMSLNGLPIARVSRGERVNVSNDNIGAGGSGPPLHVHFGYPVNAREARETTRQAHSEWRRRIADSSNKGF